jgi:hypothetical protein
MGSVLFFLAAAAGLLAQTAAPISAAGNGWVVTADAARGTLSVAHDTLGPVLNEIRLQPSANWSAQKTGEHQLTLKTALPPGAWVFDLAPNMLKISCTSSAAVLMATAPAPKDRLLVRLMDPEGVPVDWWGTDEVKNGYGGSETHNRSFLPRRNPEVMYLALGQVSSPIFHSLFDRKSGTAISFSDDTLLRRSPHNSDLLDVTMPVPGNVLIRLVPDYYTKTLGVPFYVPFDDTYFSRAPMVWSSWTSYYAEVNEDDIVRNTDWLAENLKPYGFQYVQLDDGYDRGKKGEHYWIENWDRTKFPHGPQWLTNYIKSKGLRPGLWLVPNAYAGAVEQHPDWYVRDKQGKIILDYHTPALDSTNPEVQAYLKKLFTTLNEWGFEYYKFDGEYALPAYMPRLDKSRLFDKSADPVIAYRSRLKAIYETIGRKTFVEGCPAGTPLNGVGFFGSYFNGQDLYNNWQGMYPLFSSISANAFLNHLLVYVMPGEGLELGPPMTVEEAKQKRRRSVVETARSREDPMVGFGTTLAEARTLVTHVSLTGVAYPLASVMSELPEERVRLLRSTMPTLPIVPVDLFSRGTDMRWATFKQTRPDYYVHNYPEILDLKVNSNSGCYDVVGLTNWRSETLTRDLSFTGKLGLDVASRCVVFDYWGQQLLGVFKDRMSVRIEPHDTRVLLVHSLLDRPQLIGLSRHITGAYSILDLSWDNARRTLRGISQAVSGAPYTLWFYIPEGVAVSEVHAATKGNRDVAVSHAVTGSALRVSFQGQPDNVDWEIAFR